MNKTKYYLFAHLQIKILLLPLLLLLFTTQITGYWSYNKSCLAFPDQCNPNLERGAFYSVERLVIEAAGFFLQSNSEFQQLLKEIELSEIQGMDNLLLIEILGKAIDSMKLANSSYFELWQFSKTLDYDSTTITLLKNFEYDSYQTENNLNPIIFSRVMDLLKVGDIISTYEYAFLATGHILNRLLSLKSTLEQDKSPKTHEYWRVNQMIFETQLFGQYVAEVFFSIDK